MPVVRAYECPILECLVALLEPHFKSGVVLEQNTHQSLADAVLRHRDCVTNDTADEYRMRLCLNVTIEYLNTLMPEGQLLLPKVFLYSNDELEHLALFVKEALKGLELIGIELGLKEDYSYKTTLFISRHDGMTKILQALTTLCASCIPGNLPFKHNAGTLASILIRTLSLAGRLYSREQVYEFAEAFVDRLIKLQ